MPPWRYSISVLALLVTGCASTPQASLEQDEQAKQFAARPDAATVYIYRPGSYFDNSVEDLSTVLYVDQRLIGATMAGVFFVVHLYAGVHVLSGIATDQGEMTFQVQAGRLYFISLRVRDGNSEFTQVSVETGKREVSKCCTLQENANPDRRPFFPRLQL